MIHIKGWIYNRLYVEITELLVVNGSRLVCVYTIFRLITYVTINTKRTKLFTLHLLFYTETKKWNVG